jgi:hypothetical protein
VSETHEQQLQLDLDGVAENLCEYLNVIDFAEAAAQLDEVHRALAIRRILSLREEVKEG